MQRGGLDGTAAEQLLKGTLAKDKNEILFSRFGINYNDEAEVWKKGSVVYRDVSLSCSEQRIFSEIAFEMLLMLPFSRLLASAI